MENEEGIAQPTDAVVKKSHWGHYVSLVFFILLVGAVWAVYKFAQQPAEGTIRAGASEAKVVGVVDDVPATFTGTYISFMYGNKYVLKSDELSTGTADVILERAYLTEISSFSKKINLTVRSLPSQNLADDPDYLLRENTPRRYKKETFSLGKNSGVFFLPADDSQFEKTFFMLNNDKIATLVITAPGAVDNLLNAEADAMAKSLTWLK